LSEIWLDKQNTQGEGRQGRGGQGRVGINATKVMQENVKNAKK